MANEHHDEKGRFAPAQSSAAKDMRSSEPKLRALQVGKDKQGNEVALVLGSTPVVNPDRTLSYRPSHQVLIKTGNYSSHVKGGIRYSWKVIKADLSHEEALKIFQRRTDKGK